MGKSTVPRHKQKMDRAAFHMAVNQNSLHNDVGNQTIEELITTAEEQANKFESDAALQLYDRAMVRLETLIKAAGGETSDPNMNNKQNSDDLSSSSAAESSISLKMRSDQLVDVLQATAYLLMENNGQKEAEKRLRRAIKMQPDRGTEKFMYLAQLIGGHEAVQLYRRGLQLLEKNENSSSSSIPHQQDNQNKATSSKVSLPRERMISNAYCAIAELYMTDLCDATEAQLECAKALEEARKADTTNAQAWLTTANFQLITAKTEEARSSIETCLSLFWPTLEKALADISCEETSSDVPTGSLMSRKRKRDNAVDQGSGNSFAEGKIAKKQVNQTLGDVEMEVEESESTSNAKILGNEAEDVESDENKEDSEADRLDMEEITGIPLSGLVSLCRMMIELEMYKKCADILEALLEEDEENAEIFYLLTVVGEQLWLESEPETLAYYAKMTEIISTKIGDLELTKDMKELQKKLPKVKESLSIGSDDLDMIGSTDDEAD